MLVPFAHMAVAFVLPAASPRSSAATARHGFVIAREVNFVANLEVVTQPFVISDGASIGSWFANDESLKILMSQAESSRRVGGSSGEAQQQWLVSTPIAFPGMVARSDTSMDVSIDVAAPRLSVASSESKTVCEGGPSWAQGLLSRVNDFAATKSSNIVELRDAPGGAAGEKVCVSTVNLVVTLRIPGLLLPPFVPAGPFEKAGSESIQKLLDKDMAPVLARFREGYLRSVVV